MVLGLGTDIAEVARIAKSVEDTRFKERVFSSAEIAYCESRANKNESFAARFAAKEAFFKALGTGWRGGLAFNEVEIIKDELGKPSVRLTGTTAEIIAERNTISIHVSLSHTKETAIAVVIIEGC